MSVAIRYVCHQCGAARDAGQGSWVRCHHCRALIAFDWQAWMDSPKYAAFLRGASAPESLAGWQRYQALTTDADRALARGDQAQALAFTRQAVEQMVAQTPSVYPPELSSDTAYRARYLTWLAWTMYMQKAHPELARLARALQERMHRLDWKDPLPALEEAADNLSKQIDLMARLNPPDDPDGLPPPARLRVSLTQFLGGYVQLLSPEQIRALLERIHGKPNVHETGEGVRALGLFRDWRCPACGLVSLQASTVHELTCPACVFRIPKGEATLPRFEFTCTHCGAPMVLEEGERERSCAFCDTWIRRVDRTGEVERAFAQDVMRTYSEQYGLELAPLPREGVPGLPVSKENRRALQLVGLARVAAMYGQFVPARRILGLVTATFPGVSGPALGQLFDEVRAAARAEGHQAAVHTLGEAEALAC